MSHTQLIRANLIAQGYQSWLQPGLRVLDVGCGNGEVSRVIGERFQLDLWGTDILDYRRQEIPFRPMTQPGLLPFENHTFDVVMFNDILHHTTDPVTLLQEGRRLARRVLVFEDVESLLLKTIDVVFNRFYCAAMPCPLTFRSAEAWHTLFAGLGFDVQQATLAYPFWYPVRHLVFCLETCE